MICSQPFTQLVLFTDGNVTPCCLLPNYVYGNIKENSLAEIRNSDAAKLHRREFMEGKITICTENIRHRKCHRWTQHLEDKIEISEVQRGPVLKLDVRLNGKCNLECVMCDVWKSPNGIYDKAGFWENAEKDLFPSILELDVLGGEPFIQRDTFRLLDTVPSLNPDCSWAFVTNGHWKFTEQIRRQLDRIHMRWITFSIDSLKPDVYSRIRLKGDLKKALNTLDDLAAYRDTRESTRPFELRIAMVVQIGNQDEISEFIRYARDRRIAPILTFCYEPAKFSLLSLNAGERLKILESLEEEFEKSKEETLLQVILPLRDSLDRERRSQWMVQQIQRNGFA